MAVLATAATLDRTAVGRAVLECRGLRKTFGDMVAVRGVGFSVRPGETYGLLGPNGAGKTTTISMVAGLLERDAGEVRIDGELMTTRTVGLRSLIGYVPQELAIYPDLTGNENLRFFARLYGLSGTALTRRVGEILDIIGLTERARDQTKTYSGGMKRRLNIGIGLLHRPRLLILDEPTVGVDPQSRNAILESVGRLAAAGMAVVYTTHYMEEAERLCDRVGIIDLGSLQAEGTRRELVAMVGERDRVHLTVSGPAEAAAEACRSLPGVQGVTTADGRVDLIIQDAGSRLPRLLEAVAAAGVRVTGVDVAEPNLEAVFLHLTGKALRD
jgi:ABC-2 type transport system ATP-binding protein